MAAILPSFVARIYKLFSSLYEPCLIRLKQQGERWVPFGYYDDQLERLEAIQLAAASTGLPFFIDLHRIIKLTFSLSDAEIIYDLANKSESKEQLNISQLLQEIDVFVAQHTNDEEFSLQIGIECRRPQNSASFLAWGTLIKLHVYHEFWYYRNNETDDLLDEEEYKIWFLCLEGEWVPLDEPFDYQQLSKIQARVLKDLKEDYIRQSE